MRASKTSITQDRQDRQFDSMGQAAAALGVGMEVLKSAKRAGCGAFRPGGRVQEKQLLAFIKEHGSELSTGSDSGSLKDQKIKEEIRKLKIKNDRDEKLSVLKTEVASSIRRCLSKITPMLEQKLINEYPTVVSGLGVAEVRIYSRRLNDALLVEFQKLKSELPE